MTDDRSAVEEMLLRFLTSAQQSLIAATSPGTPEAEFRWYTERATLTGMCAYLLHNVHPAAQPHIAAALVNFADDGEPLADWVSNQLTGRGVDVEAMIEESRRG